MGEKPKKKTIWDTIKGLLRGIGTLLLNPFTTIIIFALVAGLYLTGAAKVKTLYNAARTSICVGNYLPEGKYTGQRDGKPISFEIQKAPQYLDDYTDGYMVNVRDDETGAQDVYYLYFRTGTMHFTSERTSPSQQFEKDFISDTEDGAFEIRNPSGRMNQIRFSPVM